MKHSAAPHLKYRRDIDGLRSLAVIPVVLDHAGFSLFTGGFIGVDVFFVISGYLITELLTREIEERRFSIVAFYERRARRILPALMAVIFCCLTGGWFLLVPDEYVSLAKSAAATLFFSSNVYFWLVAGDYFGAGGAYQPLLHTWSLAVEEQFYLLFPLLLWLLAKGPRCWWPLSIGGVAVASFLLSVWSTGEAPVSNFYLVPTRIWELGLGALLGVGILSRTPQAWLTEFVGAVGVLAIVLCVFLLSDSTPFPGIFAAPPCLGAAAIIWAGRHHRPLSNRLLSLKPLVWIGLTSYSLYLWHWPILVAARLYYGSAKLPPIVAVLCSTLAIAVAWLSWRFVEQPFRRASKGLGLSQSGIFKAAALSTSALGAVCAVVALLDGAPSRFSPMLLLFYREGQRTSELDMRCMDSKDSAPPCVLGLPNAKSAIDVVVWGDSHAGAMLPGVERWLTGRGERAVAFTKSACPPLLGLWRVDQGHAHGCDAHNWRVLNRIRQAYPDAVVILAARWPLMVQGVRPVGEAGAPAILARSGEQGHGPAANYKLVQESLDETLKALTASGRQRVVLVGSVPEPRVDVPRAVARSWLTGRRPIGPSLASVEERSGPAEEILSAAARRYSAKVVQLAPIICTVRCRIVWNGHALYRDDDHLSVYGARAIIPIALTTSWRFGPASSLRRPGNPGTIGRSAERLPR